MQTIITKYLGPTNHKGSRIVARNSGNGKRITLSYNHALSSDQNHMEAARALKDRLGWTDDLLGGHTEPGMVWIIQDKRLKI